LRRRRRRRRKRRKKEKKKRRGPHHHNTRPFLACLLASISSTFHLNLAVSITVLVYLQEEDFEKV
jgi:hypothetical protein